MERHPVRCETCGRKRDPRITYCSQCGGQAAAEDQTVTIGNGDAYSDIDWDIANGHRPMDSLKLREKRIALIQERALLNGLEPPPPETAAMEIDAEDARYQAEFRARMQHHLDHGPGTSGQWEANPFGLSGRVIRGYRHWRNKR